MYKLRIYKSWTNGRYRPANSSGQQGFMSIHTHLGGFHLCWASLRSPWSLISNPSGNSVQTMITRSGEPHVRRNHMCADQRTLCLVKLVSVMLSRTWRRCLSPSGLTPEHGTPIRMLPSSTWGIFCFWRCFLRFCGCWMKQGPKACRSLGVWQDGDLS